MVVPIGDDTIEHSKRERLTNKFNFYITAKLPAFKALEVDRIGEPSPIQNKSISGQNAALGIKSCISQIFIG